MHYGNENQKKSYKTLLNCRIYLYKLYIIVALCRCKGSGTFITLFMADTEIDRIIQ